MENNPARIQLGNVEKRAREDVFLDGRLAVSSPRGVRIPERLLLEALDQKLGARILVIGTREATLALAVKVLHPDAEVHCFYDEAHEYQMAWKNLREHGSAGVELHLGASLSACGPPGSFDSILLAVSRTGDALLTTALLREAHHALRPRGKVLVSVDNARDSWLHKRILDTLGAATMHRSRKGSLYVARKQLDHEPRERDLGRIFGAQLFGQAVEIETEPGVFSHGALDEGTLALAETTEIAAHDRVVDLGCGSGAIGVAAAIAAPDGASFLVDSSTRATAVARRNLLRNKATGNAVVILASDLSGLSPGSFDMVLANPFYFGDYNISRLFTREASRVLKPGGRFALVTKAPPRNVEIVNETFHNHEVMTRRGYTVVQARKGV